MKNRSSIFQILLALVFVSGVVVFVLFLFQGTKKEAEVVVSETSIEISGQYGTTIDIDEIAEIRLVDDIPSIGKKINGAGLGEIRKGDFDVEGLGRSRLFLHSKDGPFIYIIDKNIKYTIINFNDKAKTMSVYDELKDIL